jgi:hypothetical protein
MKNVASQRKACAAKVRLGDTIAFRAYEYGGQDRIGNGDKTLMADVIGTNNSGGILLGRKDAGTSPFWLIMGSMRNEYPAYIWVPDLEQYPYRWWSSHNEVDMHGSKIIRAKRC